MIEYKGFYIENAYNMPGFTVCYDGDEIYFTTVTDAKNFIDSIA